MMKNALDWVKSLQPMPDKRSSTSMKIIKPKAVAIRYDDPRTAVLDTFPFMIHYSLDEHKKAVVISAVLSTSRNTKIWKERK